MLTFIVSHERSGSHLLAEAIASFSGVRVFDEVCNPHAVPPDDRPESLHAFRSNWFRARPDHLRHPSFVKQMDLNEAFFLHLQALAAPNSAVADVKYAHIHNFEEVWWPLFRRPSFFFACQRFGIRIIHLHRLNTLEAAVSAQIASKRKLWHSWQKNDENLPEGKVDLPIDAVVSDALLLIDQARWISSHWLAGVEHIEVSYEDLTRSVVDGNDAFFRVIASHVGGLNVALFKPNLQKLGKPLAESIANYEAFASACRGTVLEKML